MSEKTSRGVDLYSVQKISASDLKTANIVYVFEDEEYYYIRLYTEDNYDNTWYVLNKKTNELSWTYYTDLIVCDVLDSWSPVDPNIFKEAS
jgi:hypothetical protein